MSSDSAVFLLGITTPIFAVGVQHSDVLDVSQFAADTRRIEGVCGFWVEGKGFCCSNLTQNADPCSQPLP